MPPFLVCSGGQGDIAVLLEKYRQGLWRDVAVNALGWYQQNANWKHVAARVAETLHLPSRITTEEAA
jgi:hypothetical protein